MVNQSKILPTSCPEASVKIYEYTLRQIPEDRLNEEFSSLNLWSHEDETTTLSVTFERHSSNDATPSPRRTETSTLLLRKP
jgi:hypothetical protein